MRLRRAASKRAACANCCVNVRAMKVRRRSLPEWVVPADSAYGPWLKRLRQTADRHQAKTSRDPNEVALVVAKALEAKRPRFRYQVGFFAKLDYFPARQDADAAHLQVHHALSRPAAGKVITGRSAHLRASKTSFASLMRQAR